MKSGVIGWIYLGLLGAKISEYQFGFLVGRLNAAIAGAETSIRGAVAMGIIGYLGRW